MPTPVEMEEGLNPDSSAIYEAELTNLEAAEELPHQELNREQALDLMQEVFAPLLEAPAGIFNELDVERFVSDNAAIIAAGDMPEASGITVGAPPQERYEGDLLLESTLPLRTESDSGKAEVVDLGIEQAGGDLEPANPLVDVVIPQDLEEGINLPEVGIQVGLSDAPADRSPSTLNQSVAGYPEVAKDTSLAIALTPGGFETLTLLQSAQAPTSQTFELKLPNGANLRSTEEGGAEVVLEGEPLMGISAPSALDAAGENVPATMTVEGDTLTLNVSPDASTSFPIMLDPLYETYNWWNGITGLGGWAGYTNAAPNYYFADHATCTTYASPYSCQSGLTANAPGLYLGGLPGSVPGGSQAAWNFKVPRWSEEWANNNRPPDSFITSMTLEHIGFWHRTDSAESPALWSGIWNTENGTWIAGGYARGGSYPDWYDTKLEFSAGQNTEGLQTSFSLSNTDGHNLTAFRDAFVSAAATTIADTKIPSVVGVPSSPSKWVDQIPAAPIKVTFTDRGLGVYRLKAIPDGVSPPQWPVQMTGTGCTGTTIYPCPGTKTWEISSHLGAAGNEVRDYDPSVLPQGKNYVTVYAEDPLGNKSSSNNKALLKVDHSAPALTLSGTSTEQASVGTNAAQYTLKAVASDGDVQAATALAPFGSAGTGPGQMQRPMGAALDALGNVWVIDRENNRVMKFDETGKFLLQFGTPGSANGQFNDPRGIAVSPEGTVWVSEFGNKRVQAFNSNGGFIRKITDFGGNPAFNQPYGLAVGPGGVLWVSDIGTHLLYEFSKEGEFIRKAYGSASNPTGATDLTSPTGLATDAKGNVWVADNGVNLLRKFDSNGKFVMQFGATGTGNGQFQGAVSVAVAKSGNLLVSDDLNNRVQEFQPNGVYLRQFGSAGAGSGQLKEPRGIAVNNEGTAFVVDAGNRRMAKWSHADYDPQSGVVSTEVKVDGQLAEPKYAPGCATENCSINSHEWTLNAKDYATGQHNVEVVATDGVGRATTKPLTITTSKDTSGPKVTAINEFFKTPQSWFEQKTYAYSATMSDTGYGVTSFVFKIDGKVVKSTTQSCPNGGCAASISGSINMAGYSGGAHPAEFIATDAGGNTTKISATYNVDPLGNVSPAEAIDTLEAVEDTSDATILSGELESDPENVFDTVLHQEGASLYTTGAPAETTMTDDPADGFDIETPGGVVSVDPANIGSSATSAEIASDAAAVSGNTASSSDTVVRPIFDGVTTFQSIRTNTGPESYSWTIELGPGLDLVSIDEHTAQVFYEDGTPAMMIEAERAHDATGKEVPTTLTVDEPDGITFTVHHKSQPFTYPVVAGAGFQVGYETVTVTEPPPPGSEGSSGSANPELRFQGGTSISAPEPIVKDDNLAHASSQGAYKKHFLHVECSHTAAFSEKAVDWTVGCGNPFKGIDGEKVAFRAAMHGKFFVQRGAEVWHEGGPNDSIDCHADSLQLPYPSGENESAIAVKRDAHVDRCVWWGSTGNGNGGPSATRGHHITPVGRFIGEMKPGCAKEPGCENVQWEQFEMPPMAFYLWPDGTAVFKQTKCIDC